MEPNSLEVTLKSLTAFALKSNQNWWLSDYNSQCFPQTHTHKPCTYSVHAPALLTTGKSESANVLRLPKENVKKMKIRHHVQFFSKLNEVKVWHSDGLSIEGGSYTVTLLSGGDATF